MTLVEFFDNDVIHNILSTLILHPLKTIIIGADYDALSNFKKRAEYVLKKQNINTEIICINIKLEYSELKNMFSKLICDYENCVFDITGGNSLIHAAIGAVSEKTPISMHTVDSSKRDINIICDENGLYGTYYSAKLSVYEIISLYGGIINENSTDKSLLSGNFITDIKVMWSICNKNCSEWNRTISGIGAIVKHYSRGSGKSYIASVKDVYDGYRSVNKRFHLNENIIQRLIE